MSVEVASTKAEVLDPQKFDEVLDSYEYEGAEFQLDEEGKLEVVTYKPEGQKYGYDWPRAVKRDQLPSKEMYPDEESWLEGVWDTFYEEGYEGFTNLLRELAPCLKSPLTILAAEADDDTHWSHAEVWRVQPAAQEVENLTVDVRHA